jgi:hypothetical protein
MKSKTLIIIVVVVIIIFMYIKNKKSEHLDTTSTPSLSNEAIQSISSVYSNTSGTVTFNNLKTTGTIDVKNLNVSGGSNLVPRGTVVSWYGDITKIPATWALCDGTNGTPDLKGRFILGYNPNLIPGTSDTTQRKKRDMNATGGNEQLIANIAFNYWPGSGGWNNSIVYDAMQNVGLNILNDGTSSGRVMTNVTDASVAYGDFNLKDINRKTEGDPKPTSVTGKNTTESLPPYYVLAYIMKL